MEKNIYKLNLNESIKIDNGDWYTRVPGGWVYQTQGYGDEGAVALVFIPFNTEFRIREEDK